MIELLLQRWYEPPEVDKLHLSTLIQQLLSVMAQFGGVSAVQAYQTLCGSEAPFTSSADHFAALLRQLGKVELIQQDHDGTLVLAEGGERLVNHYSFYAAFHTPEEFRLVHGSHTLGTLPVVCAVMPETFLIFGGRRWLVLDVDEREKLIQVAPAGGGNVPIFSGSPAMVSDRVRQEMRNLYLNDRVPVYLDANARQLLEEGRHTFRRLGLATSLLLHQGEDVWLLPWRGDRVLNTMLLELRAAGIQAAKVEAGLWISKAKPDRLIECIQSLAENIELDPAALAMEVSIKVAEKYDEYLSPKLLALDYAARALDIPGAAEAFKSICESSSTQR